MHVARLAAPREPTRVERHLGEVADITRARVLEQLDKVSESHRVIVVSGPAGYGKSVLLRQWVEQRNGRHLIDDVLRAGDTVELRARRADGIGVDEAHPATAPLTDDALALLVRPRLDKEIWTAVVDRFCGRRSAAIRRFMDILPEAEAQGHVRAFLDGGAPVLSLIRDAAQRHDGPFVRQLLAGQPDTRRPSSASEPGELSSRELEVLRFLPARLTTAEIAERLFVSRNTLKTHLRNIYTKLGVTSREEAVEQADQRGWA